MILQSVVEIFDLEPILLLLVTEHNIFKGIELLWRTGFILVDTVHKNWNQMLLNLFLFTEQ